MRCPLCRQSRTLEFFTDSRRDYYQCEQCALVFVPAAQRLSAEEEKAEYDLHDNDPNDAGYRKFLSRVFEPLRQRVAAPARGLDFGCGPGPALSMMFEEAGYTMALYDPFYADDPRVLTRTYDFISCTEVVEHLHEPGQMLEKLLSLLKPGGWLGIMTKLVIDRQAFSTWHYKNDMTHVCFFSRKTFQWFALRYDCRLEFVGNDVVLLQKPAK
jgi:SAM-dependent methyltransferase